VVEQGYRALNRLRLPHDCNLDGLAFFEPGDSDSRAADGHTQVIHVDAPPAAAMEQVDGSYTTGARAPVANSSGDPPSQIER
jgi:hypothetical protein